MNRRQAELATFPKIVATLLPKLNWIILYILVENKTLESETLHNI